MNARCYIGMASGAGAVSRDSCGKIALALTMSVLLDEELRLIESAPDDERNQCRPQTKQKTYLASRQSGASSV
jgi:hypothetical protein